MISQMRSFKHRIFFLLIPVSVWAVLSLTGCGGGGNIPPASVLSSGRVTLSWDPIPGAASYNIYLATSPGVTTLNSFKISNASNPITITDLEPGTTYYFVVAVEDDSGASRQSKEVAYTVTEAAGSIEFGDILSQSKPEETSITSEAAPSETAAATKPKAKTEATQEMPAAPTPAAKSSKKHYTKHRPIKSAESPGEKSRPAKADNQETQDVTLAWDNVPNATSYNIYWSDKPGVTRQSGTKISNVKNPYKMKGLKKGNKYYFVVTAVNASGESRESAEFSFTVGQ